MPSMRLIATVMVTAVLYVTNALAANTGIRSSKVVSAGQTLGFGFVIVQIVSLGRYFVWMLFVRKPCQRILAIRCSVWTERIFNCSALYWVICLCRFKHWSWVNPRCDFPWHHLRFYWNSFNTISVLNISSNWKYYCCAVNDGCYLRSCVFLNATKIYMSRPLELLKRKRAAPHCCRSSHHRSWDSW